MGKVVCWAVAAAGLGHQSVFVLPVFADARFLAAGAFDDGIIGDGLGVIGVRRQILTSMRSLGPVVGYAAQHSPRTPRCVLSCPSTMDHSVKKCRLTPIPSEQLWDIMYEEE